MKLFFLHRSIDHLTETLGIVSLDIWSYCLSVAGTQDPLTQRLVMLPWKKSPEKISDIEPQLRELASNLSL